jgi:hypothetical protein
VKPNRFVDELVENARLHEFRAVIEWVQKELETRNFRVSCRYEEQRSTTVWGDEKIVRIFPGVEKAALWDLLHEFGHVLTGPRDRSVEVEMKAWNRGWDEVLEKFPELHEFREEFVCRRDQCVATYRQ